MHISGDIDTNILKNYYKKEILDLLTLFNGPKTVIWDSHLIGPIGLIVDYSALKDNNVIHMFQLEDQNIIFDANHHIIFIIRSVVKNVLCLHNLLNGALSNQNPHQSELHVIWLPKLTILCEYKLKDLGIYTYFKSNHNFALHFYPLDTDIASMECPSYSKYILLKDYSIPLYNDIEALMDFFNIYEGFISSLFVISKGYYAKQLHVLLKDTLLSSSTGSLKVKDEAADSDTILVILDRNSDLLTPFLTQLTYEGFIDEAIGIKCSSVKLQSQDLDGDGSASPTSKITLKPDSTLANKVITLNSSDELYHEIRDKSFNAVGQYLSSKAKVLSAQFEERFQAKTVSEVKNFVKKLPLLQNMRSLLTIHTTLAELIKDLMDHEFRNILKAEQEFLLNIDTDKISAYITCCIAKHQPLNKVLRLICIQSFTNNGLKNKTVEQYFKEILQTYGYDELKLLLNLQKSNIINEDSKTNKINYASSVKEYNLIVEKTDEKFPHDFSYVHSIYAPLSIRIIQRMLSNKIQKDFYQETSLNAPLGTSCVDVDDALLNRSNSFKQNSSPNMSHISNALLDIPMSHKDEDKKDFETMSSKSGYSGNQISNHQNIIVYMVGGITYSEISALRFLFKQEEISTNYLILTSNIINGNSLLDILRQDYSI